MSDDKLDAYEALMDAMLDFLSEFRKALIDPWADPLCRWIARKLK